MVARDTKIIVTLGPATSTEADLRTIKDKGVDFVRINMSHSTLADLERFIALSKKVGLPFIIDTEGSQVRTGDLEENVIHFDENATIIVRSDPIVGSREQLSLKPGSVIHQLEPGDLIHIDFDTLILRVTDASTALEGYVTTKAITGGYIGRNKAAVIDPVATPKLDLPTLSELDHQSIALGLREGIDHVAVSFVRSGACVDEVRALTGHKMTIISKIECIDALEHLDDIIEKTDMLLIDRGDLSKEIPVEKIPFTQKVIIHKARGRGRPVFVATNLLESMVEARKPTRAEVHDVISTIVDGAAGLTLAAETAIGKHPMECINVLNKLIAHAEKTANGHELRRLENGFIRALAESDYLLDQNVTSTLVPPHGGRLVNRLALDLRDDSHLATLPRVPLDEDRQMDVEQMAIGTYSPLDGFMNEADFHSVLTDMRLASGVVWPLPIVLDVPLATADTLAIGDQVALTDERGDVLAILHLAEKYRFDREHMARMMYGTTAGEHPGVQMVAAMSPVLLAGKIDLLRRRRSEAPAYELTPRQVRRLFDERGWAKVVGFHTRNVIHRGHEFIQMRAMQDESCDGLFVQPVIGRKKPGDFRPTYILRSYETMIESFYPTNKVVLAALATYSRYAGPREALFTALCRKNFGCSHFIVGRDHTGVGSFYPPDASHRIFDRFPDLGIQPIRFDEVYYSAARQEYVHATSINGDADGNDRLMLSGSEARALFESGEMPPAWFMRPEIAQIIIEAMEDGQEVFVPG